MKELAVFLNDTHAGKLWLDEKTEICLSISSGLSGNERFSPDIPIPSASTESF